MEDGFDVHSGRNYVKWFIFKLISIHNSESQNRSKIHNIFTYSCTFLVLLLMMNINRNTWIPWTKTHTAAIILWFYNRKKCMWTNLAQQGNAWLYFLIFWLKYEKVVNETCHLLSLCTNCLLFHHSCLLVHEYSTHCWTHLEPHWSLICLEQFCFSWMCLYTYITKLGIWSCT